MPCRADGRPRPSSHADSLLPICWGATIAPATQGLTRVSVTELAQAVPPNGANGQRPLATTGIPFLTLKGKRFPIVLHGAGQNRPALRAYFVVSGGCSRQSSPGIFPSIIVMTLTKFRQYIILPSLKIES